MELSRANSVSVLVAAMSRTEHLVRAIVSWLHFAEIGEIVVVDWNSSPPLAAELAHLADGRIRLVRVVGVERWSLSLAFNFGARFVGGPLLLKLDADSVLRPGFFERHPLAPEDNHFYSGNWAKGRDENEQHLNGIMFVAAARFRAAGGYNEWIRGYGREDTDLYDRLEETGLERRDISVDHAAHLPHDDALRSAERDLRLLIMTNMHLARKLPWSAQLWPTEYQRLAPHEHGDESPPGAREQEGVWVPVDLARYEPPPGVLAECGLLAQRSILAESGYGWDLTAGRSAAALLRLYGRRARPRFAIEAYNGLGNRLRALASAAVIAEALHRPLVLVWIADTHCEARFEELFVASEIFHTSAPLPDAPGGAGLPDGAGGGGAFHVSRPDRVPLLTPYAPGEPLDTTGAVYVASSCVLDHPLTNWDLEAAWLHQNIRPVPRIADRIVQEARRVSAAAEKILAGVAPGDATWEAWALPDVIGIHIRMGQPSALCRYEDASHWTASQREDMERNRAQSHWANFLWEAERVWRRDPAQRILLCADTPAALKAFVARHPDRAGRTLFWVEREAWDRSRSQLEEALVDVFLLSRCREVWGSPWSSFTELVERLGLRSRDAIGGSSGALRRVRISGEHFGRQHYGRVFHPGSRNIGDDIQAYAAARFLPHVDYLVDRDDQTRALYAPDGTPSVTRPRWPVVVIENGWYDGRLTRWPPGEHIRPVYVSFHINERPELFDDPRFDVLRRAARMDGTLLSPEGVAHLRAYGPVGARDQHTLDLLTRAGVPAYHTCCLALTLDDLPALPRGEEVLIVDADIDDWALLASLVPRAIIDSAARVSHGSNDLLSWGQKTRRVSELLDRYRQARLVITSRLHCALPCLAFDTPFVWLYRDMAGDPRFDATFRALLGDGVSLPPGWDWERSESWAVPPTRRSLARALAAQMRSDLHERLDAL
jgi:Polysaccharide pyruvyl transferase/N-terminal domain of galactosyltransferase